MLLSDLSIDPIKIQNNIQAYDYEQDWYVGVGWEFQFNLNLSQ